MVLRNYYNIVVITVLKETNYTPIKLKYSTEPTERILTNNQWNKS